MHIGVTQQAHQVVTDGTYNRILEVKNTGRLRGETRLNHKVAAVVVAMNKHGRLSQRPFNKKGLGALEHAFLGIVQRELQMLFQVPDWKEPHFIEKPLGVVGGQGVDCLLARPKAPDLQLNQSLLGRLVKGRGRLWAEARVF